MSIAEIQSELKKLTPVELARVEALVREIKAAPPVTTQVGNAIPGTLAEYWNSLRGTVILKPGWDEDEPLEIWESLRDNPSA
jgi:hypothetical protein